MIELSHLTHNATLTRRTAGTKNAYGKITYTHTITSIKCFFDALDNTEEVGRKYLGTQDEAVVAVAILFTEPNANIRLGDEISSIKDSLNVIISTSVYKIVKIKPALDDKGVHHLEVFITSSK